MKEKLTDLKGIGEKTAALFEKAGVFSPSDLLTYYPRNYESYESPVPINEAEEGTMVSLMACVASNISISSHGRISTAAATLSDSSGKISVVWYRAPYIRSMVRKGLFYVFRGRIAVRKNRRILEHPVIYSLKSYEELQNTMLPVYHLTQGLTDKMVRKAVRQVLEEVPLTEDFLPSDIKEQFRLADENYAVSQIHFPADMDSLMTARRRLVFDEFYLFMLSVQIMKSERGVLQNHFPMKPSWRTERIIENLPYRLTRAQQNAWNEIERDLCGNSVMSRLLQGDVGSGKTILAFLAMILAEENGLQSVLMVPTEVLAKQHYESMIRLLSENGDPTEHVILLTGSVTASERRRCYSMIESGEAHMIIGTHALIQKKVPYQENLGLVITDEQHRFGVRQREYLAGREKSPHVLVMSATPIPRTLAIILYGDLDISILDQMPSDRKPVKNCVVGPSFRQKAYRFIENQVMSGHQAYVICPLVEESDRTEAENVTDYASELQENLSPDITVGVLHGRMKPTEKNRIMEDFASGNLKVLVSTTVVEVGVNVPNATVMMIEDAQRYGLAQLHQLRGRIGRGADQSYCIFINTDESEDNVRRLDILNRSNDGFFIAGEDLKLRGPGDLFGIRQSGELAFRIGNIYKDADILKAASEAASWTLELDPDLSLPQHEALQMKLRNLISTENGVPGI